MLRTAGDDGHRRGRGGTGSGSADSAAADEGAGAEVQPDRAAEIDRASAMLRAWAVNALSVPSAAAALPCQWAPDERAAREADTSAVCARIVEADILPRLLVAHRVSQPVSQPRPHPSDAVEQLAAAAIGRLPDDILSLLLRPLTAGETVERVMLDLLAPAARLLGDWWESDHCDFIEVTAGLWRLQEAAQELVARAPLRPFAGPGARVALFAVTPGDPHQFGSMMVEELFRRAGWEAARSRAATGAELLADVRDGPFDLLALTASTSEHVRMLASLLPAVRESALNPAMIVMVGGPPFQAHPALVDEVGADGTARDARLAVMIAETMVDDRSRRRPARAGRG